MTDRVDSNISLEIGNFAQFWLIACGILAAAVTAFTLGQRQVTALWRKAAAREERAQERLLVSWRQIAEKVHTTLMNLADHYENTPEDRMRIRAVYHKDTFAALIATMDAVPVHEFGNAEAAVALCGLKKNLRDAHFLVDLYVSPMLPGNISTPLAFARIDLRPCKAFAEIHYMNFKRSMPSWPYDGYSRYAFRCSHEKTAESTGGLVFVPAHSAAQQSNSFFAFCLFVPAGRLTFFRHSIHAKTADALSHPLPLPAYRRI